VAQGYTYLAGLILSLMGLALMDWRHKTAFSINKKAASLAIFIPLVFFIIWDVAGIATGIFFRGNTTHLSGILLAPEFPIEELFFLLLLNYSSLTIFTTVSRVMAKRSAK
jgi:lycopene cyclase domain-containing protein